MFGEGQLPPLYHPNVKTRLGFIQECPRESYGNVSCGLTILSHVRIYLDYSYGERQVTAAGRLGLF